MSDDMKPTPIEDEGTRRRMAALRQHQLDGSYDEIVEQIAKRSLGEEAWRLVQAKMAHDGAMRYALFTLERQDHARRFLLRLGWWGIGTTAAILFLIATQCTGPYGGAVLDDPDHYSRRH